MLFLKNILNNDEFHYPLVHIKGKIKPFCNCDNLEVQNVTSKSIIYWPITTYGCFKIFCELVVGRNMIILACKHYSLQLYLTYINKIAVNSVEILLLTCSDVKDDQFEYLGLTLKNYKNRLLLAVKIIQSFIAESLYSNGYSRRSFYLNNEVKIFKSKLMTEKCLKMSDKELWHFFANEITKTYPDKVKNTKWIAFMSFTKYEVINNRIPTSHRDVISFTKGYSTLGANGLALLGTGSIYSFCETLSDLNNTFVNCERVDRSLLMDDSAFRGFYWSNFSTGLGAILHELSHCFGLGHSKTGIMNRGGDDINLVLSFSAGYNDCKYCFSELKKKNFTKRREMDKFTKKEEFIFSRCKSLDHYGQCFWIDNNLLMLNNHKWITQTTGSDFSKSAFILSEKRVESIHGLLLIEVRTMYPDNICVGNYNFLEQKVYSQTFNAKRISHLIKEKSALRLNFNFCMVIMDLIGNIISVQFILNMTTLLFKFCINSVKCID